MGKVVLFLGLLVNHCYVRFWWWNSIAKALHIFVKVLERRVLVHQNLGL